MKKFLLTYIPTLSILILAGCGSPSNTKKVAYQIQTPDPSRIYLQFSNKQKTISFAGRLEKNGARNSNSILYPGYNAAGFLGSILAHAAIQGGTSSSAKKKARQNADKVLEKYEDFISSLTPESIFPDNLELKSKDEVSIFSAAKLQSDLNSLIIEVDPIYIFSQNQKSIVLRNTVTFKESLNAEKLPRVVTTEIYSTPFGDENAREYWSKDSNFNLIKTIKRQFNKSLVLALNNPEENPLKQKTQTIRYLSAGAKRVERGAILETNCEEIIFISLKKELKSVPHLTVPAKCTTIDSGKNSPKI